MQARWGRHLCISISTRSSFAVFMILKYNVNRVVSRYISKLETYHTTVQGHVSTSLNILRLTTLCTLLRLTTLVVEQHEKCSWLDRRYNL